MNERFVRLGREIRRARTAARITQQALADGLDVTLHAVQQWESGKRRDAVDVLERIAEFLGVQVGSLLDPDGFVPSTGSKHSRYRDIARLEAKLDELLRRVPPVE